MRNMSKKTWKRLVWNKKTEAEKLAFLLDKAGVENVFIVNHFGVQAGESVVVRNADGAKIWDAICMKGSYGWKRGLLEVMGKGILGHDDVEGWMTARDVMKLWRCSNAAQNR